MDSLSRTFISQSHRCTMYRAGGFGGAGTERVKVQSRLLGGRTVHVFKDLPAVTAGTGRRVDVTRAACRRRWEFIAQPRGNLSLFSHVLLFPRFKAVCTPIQGSSGVLKISSAQTLWNTTFCFCKRFAKQMRTWGTREPDLRGVYYPALGHLFAKQ